MKKDALLFILFIIISFTFAMCNSDNKLNNDEEDTVNNTTENNVNNSNNNNTLNNNSNDNTDNNNNNNNINNSNNNTNNTTDTSQSIPDIDINLNNECTIATNNKINDLTTLGIDILNWSIADAYEMRYNPSLSHIYTPDGTANDMDGHYRADIDLTGLSLHPGCNRHDVYYDSTNPDQREKYYKWEQFFSLKNETPGDLWTPEYTRFPCAAKKYSLPDGVAEDTNKDIILLVHGNSITVHSWEKYDIQPDSLFYTLVCGLSSFPCADINDYGGIPDEDGKERPMLAEKLAEQGYLVIAADARHDRISSGADGFTPGIGINSGYYTPTNNDDGASFRNEEGFTTGEGMGLQIHFDPGMGTGMETIHNDNHNFDHGWAVPIYQATVKAIIEEYGADIATGRKISIIAHSLGVSAVRDAMRRLFINYIHDTENNYNPFAVINKMILLSGMNHGAATYDGDQPASQYGLRYCEQIENMKGKVSCELGSRSFFTPTYFTQPLNGPERLFETPCADGLFAFGYGQNNGLKDEILPVCGDMKLNIEQNKVSYWTLVMKDDENGTYKDKFTSEDSAKLGALNGMDTACINNETITQDDYDTSLYLLGINHLGTARSEKGIATVLSILDNTYIPEIK